MKIRLQLFAVLWGALIFMQGCGSGRDDQVEYDSYVAPLAGESVEDELSSAMIARKKLQGGKELL